MLVRCSIVELLMVFEVSAQRERTIDEFKKFAILKKGIGIESQNLCKQFNNQKTIETRWNSIIWLL